MFITYKNKYMKGVKVSRTKNILFNFENNMTGTDVLPFAAFATTDLQA